MIFEGKLCTLVTIVLRYIDDIKFQEENPFTSSAMSMTIGDSAPVKILKGGKLQKSKVERFSILNVKPIFKDSGTKRILNFATCIDGEEDFIVRSNTEKLKPQSKRDFGEIDEYLGLKKIHTKKVTKINIDRLDTKSESFSKTPSIR
jgi:hypothetical protein